MITIIFWNIAKKTNAFAHLPCLLQHYNTDVFMFAESPEDLTPAIGNLNALNLGTFREEATIRAKVRIITRLAKTELVHRVNGVGNYLSAWTLNAPTLNPQEIIIGGIHLPSKAGGARDDDQLSVASIVIQGLYNFEDDRNHRNTILIGDFNMNPYDPGMTNITAMHGLMTKDLAIKPDREHIQTHWRRFYNPMWGLFGDRTPGASGSFYWDSSVPHNTYWNILDQVLVRASLVDRYQDLQILDNDGIHNLVGNNGKPDINLSDHLPLIVRINN